MKKCFLIFTLLGLALCLTVALAYAEDTLSLSGPDEIVYQVGLPVDQPLDGGFYSGNYSRFSIFNYMYNQGFPVWTISSVDGGPQLGIEGGINGNYDWVRFYDIPGENYLAGTSYNYQVTANLNGTSLNKSIQVTYVDALPSNYSIFVAPIDLNTSPVTIGQSVPIQNGEMRLMTGKSYVVTVTADTNQFFKDYSAHASYLEFQQWSEIFTWGADKYKDADGNDMIQSGKQFIYTAGKPGEYDHQYEVSFKAETGLNSYDDGRTNVFLNIPFTLFVTDENGNVPVLALDLLGDYSWADNHQEEIVFPIYTGLPLSGGIRQWSDLIKFRISNYDEIAVKYPGEPEWTVTDNSNGALDYSFMASSFYNRSVLGMLNSMPTQAGTYEINVTCSWGDLSASRVIRVQVINPSFDFPTGLLNLPDEIETQVGQYLTIAPTLAPSGWNENGESPVVWIAKGLTEFAWRGSEDPAGEYHISNAGNYLDIVGIQIGTILVTKPVIFKVKDMNGNLPTNSLLNIISSGGKTVYLGLPCYAMSSSDEPLYGYPGNFYMWFRGRNTFEQAYPGYEPIWSVTRADGKPVKIERLTTGYFAPNDEAYCMLVLDDGHNPAGMVEYTVTCQWGPITGTSTLWVNYIDSITSYPTGLDFPTTVENVKVGDTLTIAPKVRPAGWTLPGGSSSGRVLLEGVEEFATVDYNEGTYERLKVNFTKAGVFKARVILEIDTIRVAQDTIFRIQDENGMVPIPELKLSGFKSDVNVYLGLEKYGNGIGADSIGVWGETGWISCYFSDYEALEKIYGGRPAWTIKKNGSVFFTGHGYEDMGTGVLEYQLNTMEDHACDVEYEVTCEWGDQSDSFTTTVHYIQLTTVPSGHSYPEVVDLTVGDTLTIDPTVEPAAAIIPGYDYRVYVFDEQMNEFATLDDSASNRTKKIYTVNTPGVYAATILLQADSVTIGKETIFRIADTNGVVPAVSPQLSSYCGFERNFWLVPGAVPGADGYGKLLSDDYLDNMYVSNESVCRHELQGDPVWSVSGSTDYVGVRVTSDGRDELYLKKMPATAQTMTFDVVCSWGGQTGMVSYKLHFKNTPKGLPTGVYLDPDKRVRVVPSGKPFEYEFGFRNFDQIEGSDAWQDLSESLRDAVGWAEIGGQPGIYEGYVETGFDNVMWREKMTIIVTKADGTMKKADYTPFGTVAPAPAGLKTIESQAFAGTKLTEVDIPAGVSISADAFDGTGLVAIYCHDQATVNYAVSHGYVAVVD